MIGTLTMIILIAIFLSLGYFWYMFYSTKTINEADEHTDIENSEFNPEVFKELNL
jgi:uncharacterized membrane protein